MLNWLLSPRTPKSAQDWKQYNAANDVLSRIMRFLGDADYQADAAAFSQDLDKLETEVIPAWSRGLHDATLAAALRDQIKQHRRRVATPSSSFAASPSVAAPSTAATSVAQAPVLASAFHTPERGRPNAAPSAGLNAAPSVGLSAGPGAGPSEVQPPSGRDLPGVQPRGGLAIDFNSILADLYPKPRPTRKQGPANTDDAADHTGQDANDDVATSVGQALADFAEDNDEERLENDIYVITGDDAKKTSDASLLQLPAYRQLSREGRDAIGHGRASALVHMGWPIHLDNEDPDERRAEGRKGDQPRRNQCKLARQWAYGGPNNEPEVWDKWSSGDLPTADGFLLEKYMSDCIEADLNAHTERRKRLIEGDAGDIAVEAVGPYTDVSWPVIDNTNRPWFESGTPHRLPQPWPELRAAVRAARPPHWHRLHTSLQHWNQGAHSLDDSFVPRVALPRFVLPPIEEYEDDEDDDAGQGPGGDSGPGDGSGSELNQDENPGGEAVQGEDQNRNGNGRRTNNQNQNEPGARPAAGSAEQDDLAARPGPVTRSAARSAAAAGRTTARKPGRPTTTQGRAARVTKAAPRTAKKAAPRAAKKATPRAAKQAPAAPRRATGAAENAAGKAKKPVGEPAAISKRIAIGPVIRKPVGTKRSAGAQGGRAAPKRTKSAPTALTLCQDGGSPHDADAVAVSIPEIVVSSASSAPALSSRGHLSAKLMRDAVDKSLLLQVPGRRARFQSLPLLPPARQLRMR